MTRRPHRFRSAARDLIVAKALLRHTILNDPATLRLLNRYIASLNLRGRVASGQLSDMEALIEFERAIHLFARRLHTALNNKWAQQNLDQTDLSVPLNMQMALNNPLSLASILMNDAIEDMKNAINNEIEQNKQQFEQDMQQASAIAESPEEDAAKEMEKTALRVGAITLFDESGADAAKGKIEAAFFLETAIKTEFHTEEPQEEASSILQHVLKPQFKDFQNDDKDKG